ncbi:MAG TPA: hypothetical protein VFI91_13905 [Longimicrobiaceae bacterium]|nr:hypothetical protein [Longimicrobiaceae bacterium]
MGDRTRWIAIAALGIAVLSLAANVVLIRKLRNPQQWALPAVIEFLETLAAEDASFTYEVRLPAGTPLALDLPVDETFSVAVDTVIPIRTEARLPIDSPLGSYTVTVPVRADVPLRTRVPIRIRHTFELRTRTTDEIVFPLEIRIRDLPLDSLFGS